MLEISGVGGESSSYHKACSVTRSMRLSSTYQFGLETEAATMSAAFFSVSQNLRFVDQRRVSVYLTNSSRISSA